MNKKGAVPFLLIAIISFALVGVGIYYGVSSTGDISDYSNVYKANYGHLCCLAGNLETLDGPKYADDKTYTICSENVDECKVSLTAKFGGITGKTQIGYRICNADGSSCSGYSSKYLTINVPEEITLAVGKRIEFYQGATGNAQNYIWERKGSVYNLVGQENGKIFVENGCELSSSLKGKVLSGISNTIPKGYSSCVNYVTDFVSVATKTYRYSGQDVICQARAIYKIDKQTFKDGNVVKIQGDKIKDVECCPSESNCNNNFEFDEDVEKECTYSTECDNGGDYFGISQTTAGYFKCEDGQCVKKTKSVECTSDAVCQQRHGEGYVCDLSEDNWGTCIKAPTGTYCGDGYCDIGESKSTCPSDCELECAENEKLVATTKKVGQFCFFGIGFCDEQVIKECRESGLDWGKIILISLIIIAIFLFLLPTGKPIRKFLKLPF